MSKFMKRMSRKVAQAPGMLIHIGEETTEKVKITVTTYNEGMLEEKEVEEIEALVPRVKEKQVTWINLDGVHNIEHIERIGQVFNIHPLVLEDIVNTLHRPKMEDFEDYIFVVLKMLSYDRRENGVKAEHISLILAANYEISFQEREGDVFEPVREQLRKTRGRIRKMGADFLFYTLLDAVVDNYFLVLEGLEGKIEGLEEDLVQDPQPKTLQTLHELKQEMIYLRKAVWPLREVVNSLLKIESRLVHKTTALFLRDVYDHTIHVIETAETFRDMVSGMQDIYLSSISNKMNEVMKVLTIIATIFIPLTFIAGIYGMNFNPEASPFNMPELNARYGYVITWAVMIVAALVMLFYFKRKKWL